MSRVSFGGVTYDAVREVVDEDDVLLVIGSGGEIGPKGEPGPPGPPGEPGPSGEGRGTRRFHGEGPPTAVIGAQAGDEYLDLLTGDLYVLT